MKVNNFIKSMQVKELEKVKAKLNIQDFLVRGILDVPKRKKDAYEIRNIVKLYTQIEKTHLRKLQNIRALIRGKNASKHTVSYNEWEINISLGKIEEKNGDIFVRLTRNEVESLFQKAGPEFGYIKVKNEGIKQEEEYVENRIIKIDPTVTEVN